MKPLFVSVLMFLPFAFGARYYFVCQTLQWCDGGLKQAQKIDRVSLQLPENNEIRLSLGRYAPQSITLGKSKKIQTAVDSLVQILHFYPKSKLKISGPIGYAEPQDDEHFSDIGIARSADLSSKLQQSGITADKIELSSYLVEDDQAVILKLEIKPEPKIEVDYSLPTGDRLLDSTALLGLRFASNSTALSPTEDLIGYAEELILALNENKHLQITLTGHTDDQANEVFNDSLGLWRAQAVAAYFKQMGYEGEIFTKSKGEKSPIAPNSTLKGRFLNRRVEVTIE